MRITYILSLYVMLQYYYLCIDIPSVYLYDDAMYCNTPQKHSILGLRMTKHTLVHERTPHMYVTSLMCSVNT